MNFVNIYDVKRVLNVPRKWFSTMNAILKCKFLSKRVLTNVLKEVFYVLLNTSYVPCKWRRYILLHGV